MFNKLRYDNNGNRTQLSRPSVAVSLRVKFHERINAGDISQREIGAYESVIESVAKFEAAEHAKILVLPQDELYTIQ